MLKFGNREFRNIQEQVEKNAKDIEKLIEEGVPGTGSELPPEKPTDNGQILLGNINGSVEWSTETIREFQHELVSGENIKTINGVSILGSGNIQIEGGGTVSEDHVIELADNALISHTTINPYAVDEATMAKLQDPNTIIKYNNYIYYYDKFISGTNNIVYKGCTTISNNTAYGTGLIYYDLIYVRIVAGDYPTGLWYAIDTISDVPCTLGTKYTEDGDYIWVASKSGNSADSAWQKYTPGSGGSVDLSNYYTKTQVDSQFVDNATFNTTTMGINTILKDIPNTYATKTTVGDIDTRVTALENANDGFAPSDAVTDDEQILVGYKNGTYSWSTQTLPEIWNHADTAYTTANAVKDTINEVDAKVTALDTRVDALEAGGSVDLSNYYTKTEADNQFTANTVFNTTTMGINTILNDIPNTYATKTTVDDLETQLRQEIGGIDTRVTTLENAGGSGGGFNPVGSVTDDGQILIGNVDGTYTWATQTIQELWNTIESKASKTYVDNLILSSLQGDY